MSRNTFEGRNGRRVYIPNGMGWRYFNHADLMPKELRERVEHLAYTYGRSYDSYLVTEPDREYFMNSKDDAVISFVTVGRYVNVVGGAIGTDEARAELLKSFLDFCRQNSLTCSFFSILGDEIDQYRGLGFEVTKFGEDFRIDVSKLDWSGKNFSWVRRQVHYVQKNGVVARELRRSDVLEESWNAQLAELREVERGQLATKSQGEPTKVFQGQITSPDLGRRRLFAAYDSQSRAECFLVCNPIDGGNSWAIEIYRHRLDCTRGSMAFLFHHTLSMLKSEGCQVVSLSMNPAIRCQDPLPGDSALCRNILIFWDKHLNFLLDLRGV
ncbi:MAG: DUF2156 domain-containing protein, partial [Proteobacteria bacterium]|nr:DUF2156 domain-containing protein [Pseudomonadota bacterium]